MHPEHQAMFGTPPGGGFQGGGGGFKGKAKGGPLGIEGVGFKGAWGKGGGERAWAGIPNLLESLTEAFREIAPEEPDLSEIMVKIKAKVCKNVERYSKDERLAAKGSATQAKALIEEFVESIMGSISGTCYDKPWFNRVVWTQPLLVIVIHVFDSSKMFSRVLKPKMITFIEEGFFKWQEETRITKAIWDAVVVSGVNESHQKKANQSLMKAFDSAHFKAPYGSTTNESPELAVLQDFTKGWMAEFLALGWSVLESGLADGSEEAQVSTLAVLFQNLLDPNVACMPYEIATEITNTLGGLPAAPWPFIDEAAAQVFAEAKNGAAGAKKRRM